MTRNLLVRPDLDRKEYICITPAKAGWQHIHFSAIRISAGEKWEFSTEENELALTILGGTCDVTSNVGEWKKIGSRKDVFSGMPTTLFLSRYTQFTVTAALGGVDLAVGWAAATQDFPPRLVRPEDVIVELRGGENASRQINKMLPAGFPCQRLVVVEVFTPGGNWSSYPPHKHDQRILSPDGTVLEADLEEIYFYKIKNPESGFAYQRIYNDNRSLDELILVKNDHLVLSPEGYHPVVAAPGFDCYYLNILAGSDQSLASTDDPVYAWVKSTWKKLDPRLPMVTLSMNQK
jgi:5-deoxy-glucuronate isomerase